MLNRIWRVGLSALLAVMLLAGVVAVSADGTAVIGTLVITNPNNVNVRSGGGTSYGIVGLAAPGDIYQVISRTSNGWYEIVLDNGTTGFVSGNLVQFTPGAGGTVPVVGDVSRIRATIPVYYRAEGGQNLYTDYVTLAYGGNNVLANNARVPAGYTLISARQVAVNVDASGIATPSAVIFTYRGGAAAPTQAQLPIYYKDVFGTLLNTGYATLQPGSSLITPNASLVPVGYQLVGPRDMVVSVSTGYVANPASVTFVYTRVAATPQPVVNAMVPVFYRTSAGAYLNTAYLSLSTGTTNVTYNPQLVPAGFVVVSPSVVAVTVSSAGLATPASVTFMLQQNITPAPVVTTTLPVYYRSASGYSLNTAYVGVTQGLNTVQAVDSNVPPGYTLVGSRTQQVSVDAYGNANPNSLTFYYYEPAAQPTAVPAPPPAPVITVPAKGLTVGARGAAVTALQNALRNLGLYQGAANGTYDDALWAAVWHYQKNNGMSATGVADAAVFAKLGITVGAPAPQQPGGLPGNDPGLSYPNGEPTELPGHVVVSAVRGSWPVYSGPGPDYYRVANATLGGGRIRVYGQENGWVLIGYGTTNDGYRIGFVSPDAIPAGTNPPVLRLGWKTLQNNSTNLFTDDPILARNRVLEKNYPAGNTFHVLAYLDRWAYVEIEDFEGGWQNARGFVSRRSLGL